MADQPWGRSPSCSSICKHDPAMCECCDYDGANGVDGEALGAVLCLLSAIASVSFAAWLAGWLAERFGG